MDKTVGEGAGDIPSIQEHENPNFWLMDTFLNSETNLDQLIALIQDDRLELDSGSQKYGPLPGSEAATNHDASIDGILDSIERGNGEESSAAGNIRMATRKKKTKSARRSGTLILERKRRGRMKEKLYALRTLVPNITKMDKASIIGDAVLHVQDLQMQLKKLRSEIAAHNSSSSISRSTDDNNPEYQSIKALHNSKKTKGTNSCRTVKKIIKMDILQVEERGFYVRILCNRMKGIAVLLYRALESLNSFTLNASNLAAASQNYVLTFTLRMAEVEKDMGLLDVKMRIKKAFLDQGFEFGKI